MIMGFVQVFASFSHVVVAHYLPCSRIQLLPSCHFSLPTPSLSLWLSLSHFFSISRFVTTVLRQTVSFSCSPLSDRLSLSPTEQCALATRYELSLSGIPWVFNVLFLDLLSSWSSYWCCLDEKRERGILVFFHIFNQSPKSNWVFH